MNVNIVETVKKEVSELAPNSEIILFGSRARGDFRKDSDWDFLILLNSRILNKHKKAEIRDRLYDIELATDEAISSIIHTKAEWEKRAVTPIYQVIQKEGISA